MSRPKALIAAATTLIMSIGCNGSPEDKLTSRYDQMTKRTEIFISILQTVRDPSSFEAAKPRLDVVFAEQREEARKGMEALKNFDKSKMPTDAEMKSAIERAEKNKNSPENVRLQQAIQKNQEAQKRLSIEMNRCMSIPGFLDYWMQQSGFASN